MNKKIFLSTLILSTLLLGANINGVAQTSFSSNSQGDFENFKQEFFNRYPTLRNRYLRLKNRRQNRPQFISLGDTNFEPLLEGHYEGWAIDGEDKISFGKFNINDRGRYVDVNGRRINPNRFQVPGDVNIEKLVITIEPEGDTDDIPTGIIVAESSQGSVDGRLSFQALDLNNTSGSYVLTTPSDDPEANDTSGVWFIVPGNPLQPSLNLPSLDGTNWAYEGWAVFDGTPLTTGTFKNADQPDNFGGFNASDNIPPFPGEDFLRNLPNGIQAPIDLANGSSKIVITLEPELNGVDPTGESPFQIKFLVDNVPGGAQPGTNINLDRDLSTIPFVQASIR